MNGRRTLLTYITLAACLASARDGAAQVRGDRTRGADIANLRADLICRIKAWYVPPNSPVHDVPIPNDESLHWPGTMPVTVLVEVSNKGGVNAGPFHSEVRITKNGGQIAVPPGAANVPISALEPRQIWRSVYYHVPLTRGTVDRYGQVRKSTTNEIAVSVNLDIDNTVTEGSEANNQCITQFTIVVD